LLADRAGFRLPTWPDEGRREGSLVKSATAPLTSWFSAAPSYFAFRASRPALARPERSGSESDGLGAEAAARAALWSRLETVQKVFTRRAGPTPGQRCPVPADV